MNPLENRCLAAGKAAIRTRCEANKSGWSKDDSVATIMAAAQATDGEPLGAEDVQGLLTIAEFVVNPSQCRQALEAAGRLTPEPKGDGRKRGNSLAKNL